MVHRIGIVCGEFHRTEVEQMLTFATESAQVQPLSSSPSPLKVKFEPIPIGLPVVEPLVEIHDMSTPPVTVRSPA